MKERIGLALLAVSAMVTPALAEKMPQPQVEYSADTTIDTDLIQLQGKTYYSPGKQRQEMGQGTATILRRDKGVAWQLLAGKKYMESSLSSAEARDPLSMEFERTEMGRETVNGLATTKYKVVATAKDGKKFNGFIWTTPQNILIKGELTVGQQEMRMRVGIDVKNLKIGAQDPQLFEIPPGYVKTDMAQMQKSGQITIPAGIKMTPEMQRQFHQMMKQMQQKGTAQ